MNPIPSEMNFALLAAASVNYFLKTRRIAYFITDRNQVVLLFGGDSTLMPDQQAVTGQLLSVTAPELIGMEAELTAILAGRLPGVQLTLVHREDRSGQAVYVNLITLPYGDATGTVMGLVHIVEDISAQGITEQLIAQQRNELLLLRDQLASQNMQLTAINAELQALQSGQSPTALLTELSAAKAPFFKQLKDLTVDGYYTSKEGLAGELGWHGYTALAEFKGCTHEEHQG